MGTRGAHRDNDRRKCNGRTRVQNQSTVFVNDKLWAVKDSEEIPGSHSLGGLINRTGDTVFVEGKPVIVHGPDPAKPDGAGHRLYQDATAEGSANVFAYTG